MKKCFYHEPELEVIPLTETDVITTSGLMQMNFRKGQDGQDETNVVIKEADLTSE